MRMKNNNVNLIHKNKLLKFTISLFLILSSVFLFIDSGSYYFFSKSIAFSFIIIATDVL